MRENRIFGVLLFLLTALSCGCLGYTEEIASDSLPRPMTMDQAVTYGLDHNRTLRAAGKDVQATGQQVNQVLADFFPKVDGRYSVTHLKDQPIAVFGDLRFPTAPTTANRWEIDLTQPIFTGFGLTAKLHVSKMDLKISEYRREETRLNVIRDIKSAFLQTLLGQKLYGVAQENVTSLEVQRRNAEANFQQGLVAQNDVLKADVALAQALQKERTAGKQLTLLRSRLNQLLDLDLHTTLELAETELPSRGIPGLDELYNRSEEERPEYLAIETSIRQTIEAIRVARSRYYPQLSAFAQYYREGEDFLAHDNPFTNNSNAAIGLRVDWNFFEGGKTLAATKELQYRQSALEERRRELKQQIRVQVEDAYEQLQVAKANIETAQAALKQAAENDRMTALQYREQLVIFLEVLNAQVFLAQTRADYFQALYGYQIALADLERAVGGSIQASEGKKK